MTNVTNGGTANGGCAANGGDGANGGGAATSATPSDRGHDPPVAPASAPPPSAALSRVFDLFERAISADSALDAGAKHAVRRRYLQCALDYSDSIEHIRALSERLEMGPSETPQVKRARVAEDPAACAGASGEPPTTESGHVPPASAYSPYSLAAASYAYQQQAYYHSYYHQAQTFHAQQAYAAASAGYYGASQPQAYAAATPGSTS